MTKKIPDFKSKEEEEKFWKTHDAREYINWENAGAFVDSVFKDRKIKETLFQACYRLLSPSFLPLLHSSSCASLCPGWRSGAGYNTATVNQHPGSTLIYPMGNGARMNQRSAY